MSTPEPTPRIYLNEDGDYWVPVEGVPYLIARREAKSIAALSDESIRYIGKEKARLTEHEAGCNCGEPDCYRMVLAYHFEGVVV